MSGKKLRQALVHAPLKELLDTLTRSVAETQEELNEESLNIIRRLSGADPSDRVTFGTSSYSLLELGLVPSFYKLGPTDIELKLSLELERASEGGLDLYGAPVNSLLTQVYGFPAEGATTIRATLVPVATPTVFESRVVSMLEEVAAEQFATVREYLINSDTSALTLAQLEHMRIKNIHEQHLTDYQEILLGRHPDEVPDIPSLQAFINRANALVVIRKYATTNDARPMTIRELFNTDVQGAIARNLKPYRRRVESEGAISGLDALQIIIDQVNALVTLRELIELNALENLSLETLEATGVSGVLEAHLALYRTELAALPTETLDAYENTAIQQLVDVVNAAQPII